MPRHKGSLVALEFLDGKGGGMNAKRYWGQVLKGPMLRFFQKLQRENLAVLFQQNNTPAHKAKTIKKWFARARIPLFPHPACSPDLFPIEMIWHLLKHHINSQLRHPTLIDELKRVVQEEWGKILQETIDHYIKSMPRHILAVLKTQGESTGL